MIEEHLYLLACPETEMHPVHRALLLQARGEATWMTRTLSGRPARAIVNRYIAEMRESTAELLPFPLQYSLLGPLNAASRERDSSDLKVMWAGQGAALARPLPAGELLAKLADEAQAVIADM